MILWQSHDAVCSGDGINDVVAAHVGFYYNLLVVANSLLFVA